VAADTPMFSAATAGTAAQRLLEVVPRAPGARAVATLPRRLFRGPAGEPAYAHKAVRERFWISTAAPFATLGYIASHGPWKRDYIGWGGTAGHTEEWGERLDARFSGVSTGPRYLLVAIVRYDRHRSAIRVSSVVAWFRHRPAWSMVPATARWLQLRLLRTRYGRPGPPQRDVLRTFTTVAPSAVRSLAEALNRLPLAEPGGFAPACPAEFEQPSVVAALTFATQPHGASVARAAVYPDRCMAVLSPEAWVQTAGHARVTLSVNQYIVFAEAALDVWPRLEAAFGVKLRALAG
jgi:hypothetical protein